MFTLPQRKPAIIQYTGKIENCGTINYAHRNYIKVLQIICADNTFSNFILSVNRLASKFLSLTKVSHKFNVTKNVYIHIVYYIVCMNPLY